MTIITNEKIIKTTKGMGGLLPQQTTVVRQQILTVIINKMKINDPLTVQN